MNTKKYENLWAWVYHNGKLSRAQGSFCEDWWSISSKTNKCTKESGNLRFLSPLWPQFWKFSSCFLRVRYENSFHIKIASQHPEHFSSIYINVSNPFSKFDVSGWSANSNFMIIIKKGQAKNPAEWPIIFRLLFLSLQNLKVINL